MFAIYVKSQSHVEPLSGLQAGEITLPDPPEGWRRVKVKAAALNHHDIWSLRGVGLSPDRLPMVLGCDAAGVDDDGREVIVHAVISRPEWDGDETEDPKRSLLSEVHPGTLAEYVWVPARNLVPKPAELTFEEAACLPTSWLTAYRMLFTKAQLRPGETVLVQGATGGVSSAVITLAKAAGARVWTTTRDPEKKDLAVQMGAHAAFASGERLPERVDAVIDSVGEATWGHSLRALRPGGRLVTCGATSGPNPPSDLNRVFFLQLQIMGATMGTRKELERLARMLVLADIRPAIDKVLPLSEARTGFQDMLDGKVMGKIVLKPE